MSFTFLQKDIRDIRGFTLIEMMIVLAVIAILVALAYPSYLEQVRKTRRADAESALLNSAQLLERCFTRFNAYNHASCPTVTGNSENGHYTVSFTDGQPTATTYELQAVPQGGQTSDVCGTYTLDYLGNKTPAADSKRCWGSS